MTCTIRNVGMAALITLSGIMVSSFLLPRPVIANVAVCMNADSTTTFDAQRAYAQLLQDAALTLDAYDDDDLPAATAGLQNLSCELVRLWAQPTRLRAVVDVRTTLEAQQQDKNRGVYFGFLDDDGISLVTFRKANAVTVLRGHRESGELQLRFRLWTAQTTGFDTKPAVVASLKDWYSGFGEGRPAISVANAIPDSQQ